MSPAHHTGRTPRRPRALLPLAALCGTIGCGEHAASGPRHAATVAESSRLATPRTPSPDLSSTPAPPRRPLPPRRVRWVRGGSERDTLLAYPVQAAADSANLYILDSGRGEVVALHAATGTVAWRRATPRPPRAIAVLPGGGLAVAEGHTSTLSLLDPAGRLLARLTLPADTPPIRSLCALSPSHLLATTADTSHTLLEIRDGATPRPLPLPWPDLAPRHYLTTQVTLTSTADGATCAIALSLGRGFSTFDGTRFTTPASYVEPFDLPGVTRTRSTDGDRTITREQLSTDRAAARAIALANGRLLVSFGGESALRARIVDVYAARSGAYLGTSTLPHRIAAMAAHGRTLYVLYQRLGRPAVAALADTTIPPPDRLTRR